MVIAPKTFGENLNEWFKVLGRTWKPLLLVSLVAFVPVSLVIAVTLAFTGAADVLANLMDPEYLDGVTDSEILSELGPMIWVAGAWIVLQSIASLYVYLAASRTIAEDRAGALPTWRSAAKHAARRLVPALGAALIVTFGFALLAALAVVIGWWLLSMLGTEFLAIFVTTVVALTTLVVFMWLGLSVSLYPQVMAIEPLGPAGALRRSFSLVRERWWVTLGFVLVTSIIASAVSQIVGIAFVPLSIVAVFNPQVLAVVYLLAGLLQGPVAAAVAAAASIWYLDLRSRNESLDTDQIV